MNWPVAVYVSYCPLIFHIYCTWIKYIHKQISTGGLCVISFTVQFITGYGGPFRSILYIRAQYVLN